jgi:hypothetical protein
VASTIWLPVHLALCHDSAKADSSRGSSASEAFVMVRLTGYIKFKKREVRYPV